MHCCKPPRLQRVFEQQREANTSGPQVGTGEAQQLVMGVMIKMTARILRVLTLCCMAI